MKGIKSILIAVAAAVCIPAAVTSCSDWTESEAKDYYVAPTDAYYNNLKDYFASPHKVMFGWFGSWAAGAKSNSLMGLPDSVDFVGLWLVWGNLTDAQQADLDAFQARGSKTVMSWTARNIGENITPSGYTAEEYWGFTAGDEESCIAAAKKYALALVDTCNKYNIGGYDLDMEATGTLMNFSMRNVCNEFLRTLRSEFDKTGKMLCVDIPGGTGWLAYYDLLDEDVVLSLDYIMWQTYELNNSGLDSFFDVVKTYKPDVFEQALAKSVVCTTFERAADKPLFLTQMNYKNHLGLPHAGMGAYHIEYDYSGNPDYPYVRQGISTQNPPIRK
jgi:hypothetical protein